MKSLQPQPVCLGSLLSVNDHYPFTQAEKTTKSQLRLKPSLPNDEFFSTALHSLRTSIDNGDSQMGSCVHGNVLKLGLEADVFISNNLLAMYGKCGRIQDATKVFENMPHRTVVSWTSMMHCYCKNEMEDESVMLFLHLMETLEPNEYTLAVLLQACSMKGYEDLIKAIHCCVIKYGFVGDGYLQNSLIDAYAKCGMIENAERLLQRNFSRDVVSWTSIISGCVCNGMRKEAISLFFEMQEDGVLPNEMTMLSIIQAFSKIQSWQVYQWIYGFALKCNWCRNPLVMNALIEMYTSNGYFHEGIKLFGEFDFTGEDLYPTPETMSSLLQGCGNLELLELGKGIHGYLIKHKFLPCIIIENSLINMYAENKQDDSALQLFVKMSDKDIISWNTMISCFVKNNRAIEALNLFNEVHRYGPLNNVFPDFVTVLASLQGCSDLALQVDGEIIHGYVIKKGFLGDIFVQNTLIDMYAKSGRLNFAERIFREMNERDLSSWNSMIAAYGNNGNGTSALQIFKRITGSGTCQPNAITLVNILSACAHAGLVEEGFEIFNSMERYHGIKPGMVHYACMVDLLGKAGRLEEAEAFISRMPIRPGPDIWGALLGASMLFGNVIIAERAAKVLKVLEPTSSSWRVALANTYAAVGRWNDAMKLREGLKTLEVSRKEGGWSSVNVEGHEFSFLAGDTKNPHSKTIYEVVNRLQYHMRDAAEISGYCNSILS